MTDVFRFSLPDFSFAFLSILLEGVPFLLIGTILSGLIDQFLPARLMTRLLPRNAYAGAAVSGLPGLVFPMCECGVVPVIRRLIARGLPVSNAIAYMLAAPIVNPVVALSTYAAFKGQDPVTVTLFRLGLGYLVAVLVGMIVHNIALRLVLKPAVLADVVQSGGGSSGPAGGVGDRLWRSLAVCVGDFLGMMLYFIIGAGAAALFNTSINQATIAPLAANEWMATGSMMLLAALLCLCSATDAFIAATLTAFPMVAKLAFLVFGPMVDLKLVFIYSAVFRKRFVAALAVGLFFLIGLLCLRLNALGLAL